MKKEYVKPEIITVDVSIAFTATCSCRQLTPRPTASFACTGCAPAVTNTYMVS